MTENDVAPGGTNPPGDRGRDGKGNGRERSFSVIDRRPAFGDDAQPAERALPTYVEELKTRAEEAERRAREISAAYRRIDEERDAFRERLARDLERRVEMARADFLRKVLDVLDDLERASESASGTLDPASLLSGITLIRDRLLQILRSEGVQAIETVGSPFDPATAEAIATEATADAAEDNRVLAENSKGYLLDGFLLRPARVRVGRYEPPVIPDQGGSPGMGKSSSNAANSCAPRDKDVPRSDSAKT